MLARVGAGAAEHPDAVAGVSIISIYLLLLFTVTSAGVATSATMTA
jgi:hypothetical protein